MPAVQFLEGIVLKRFPCEVLLLFTDKTSHDESSLTSRLGIQEFAFFFLLFYYCSQHGKSKQLVVVDCACHAMRALCLYGELGKVDTWLVCMDVVHPRMEIDRVA